jgi:hypothetical protein
MPNRSTGIDTFLCIFGTLARIQKTDCNARYFSGSVVSRGHDERVGLHLVKQGMTSGGWPRPSVFPSALCFLVNR